MRSGLIPQDRDTYIYYKDGDTKIGSLRATPGMTNANLYSMIEHFCTFSMSFRVCDEVGDPLPKDNAELQMGNYFLETDGFVGITEEPIVVDTKSTASGGRNRTKGFCKAVRQRDMNCVVSGLKSRGATGVWTGFEAAHIFPVAFENYWNDSDYGSWITELPTTGGSINSVQNGILLCVQVHGLFDRYEFSIDPDDGYKIICFTPGACDLGIAGRLLDPGFINNPLRPVDDVLRWHFRQAVLVNLRHLDC